MSSQANPSGNAPTPLGSTPAPKASPTPGENNAGKAKVVLLKTADRATGTAKVIDLFGANPIKGKRVVLKPNFNTADPTPGSTHNDTLRSLVLKLKEMGAVDLTVAERSAPDTRTVMQDKGIFKLAEELGFILINIQELDREGFVEVNPPGSHWKNGYLFPRVYQNAECIVQTCCLKTHGFGGHFTLSLKLAVGMVPRVGYEYMREMHASPNQRKMIAELNWPFKPDLIVLDGIEAFVEGGPATGKRVRPEVMLAGNDRVAIDAVGVAILRHFGTTPEVSNGPIFKQEQIARAVELGLGVDSPEKIEIITDGKDSEDFAAAIKKILLS